LQTVRVIFSKYFSIKFSRRVLFEDIRIKFQDKKFHVSKAIFGASNAQEKGIESQFAARVLFVICHRTTQLFAPLYQSAIS